MATVRTRLRVTSLESREVMSTTNLFDAGAYLARNPDVADAVRRGAFNSAEQHFRLAGDREGRAGNSLFDTRVYLDDNPDVRDAVERGQMTAFRHFELAGQFEGRNPSRAFRAADYLASYGDVSNAVRAGQFSAFEHFLRHGQFEDRLPFAGFDRSTYLDDNPDVRTAVQSGQMTAVFHYENFGRFENRRLATATAITVTPGQATVLTGTSLNHDDRKFFRFTPSRSGTLRVVVESSNGVFAQVEVENAITSANVLETDPNDGVNTATGPVTGSTPYLLRVRAPRNAAAQFTVRVTLT